MYEKFLSDPKDYAACESYWERLIERNAHALGQDGQWVRWIPQHWANGTSMERDGNPIFDARNNNVGRAIRIIQDRIPGRTIDISAWIKSYEEEYTDLPHHELVVSLALTDESSRIAEDLIKLWMAPDRIIDEAKSFIRNRIPYS